MFTENRWRRTLLIALFLVAAAFVWQGRVAAMPNGAPTMDDLLKKIETLERQAWLSGNNQEYALGVESMRAVWQDHEEENVDGTHPLTMNVYIPEDCKLIDRAFLRLKLLAFRSYGTGAAAGGDHRHMVFRYGGADLMTSDNTSAEPDHDHAAAVGADGGHLHTYSGPLRSTSYSVLLDPEETVTGAMGLDERWTGLPGNEFDIYTWGSSEDHTHDLTHGIYEGTSATDVTVTINGTDRTVALGGAATGFTADQDSLDIAAYLTVGWNTISLASSQLGRIQATYFVKAYLP